MSLRVPGTRLRVLTAVAGLVAASAAVLAPPALSASPKDAVCPTVYPVSDLTAGQPVTGLTVSSGNTPDTFTGQVLGVLTDGIAPGIDLITVRLTSPAIDQVGGIWAGMSGSPVYAADGSLIGAVSYGLNSGSPSPIAGVTPAADMEALLNASSSTAVAHAMAANQSVTLPKAMQRRIVSNGLATSGQASAGLTRLRLPLSVSGMANGARLKKAASLMGMSGVDVYRAGSAPAAPPTSDEIFAGSNLAASISYGDYSAVGTGTTTMVCGEKVVGFGHPFNFTGTATMTLHGADALFIQDDNLFGPFKVSNTTGPVGTIDGDHLAGISGALGQLPDTTLVHSVVTGTDGTTRTGNTYVSVPDYLSQIAALAELANQDRVFDRIGAGSSFVRFTIQGTADGKPFSLVRTDRFASSGDISFQSVTELLNDVQSVLDNRFTDVTISTVRISTHISPDDREFSIGKVERLVAGHYHTLTRSSTITAKAGATIRLRVTLNSRRNEFGSKTIKLAVKVPNGRVGIGGVLTLAGGDRLQSSGRTTSFNSLLTRLAHAPRNDQLGARIDLFRRARQVSSSTTAVANDVVQGLKSYKFTVVR